MASLTVLARQLRDLGVVDPPPEHWVRLLDAGGTSSAVMRATFYKWPPHPSPASSDASVSAEDGDDVDKGEEDEAAANDTDGEKESFDSGDDAEDGHGLLGEQLTPMQNVAAAADYATKLLASYDPAQQTYAVAGGVAMVLRGSRRTTDDVDIVFKGSLPQLYRMMLQEARLVMPSSRLFSNAVRLYVKTGPAFGDDDCAPDANRLVKVELLVGDLVPLTDFARQCEQIRGVLGTRTLSVPTLTVVKLLKSKLRAFAGRQALKDLSDIVFLVRTYAAAIRAAKAELDQQAVMFVLEQFGPTSTVHSLLAEALLVREEDGKVAGEANLIAGQNA